MKTAQNNHLGLLHLNVTRLAVNHAERDTPGLRGEHPADGGPTVSNSDSDDAVTTGLDEELPATITKLRNIIRAERNSHPGRVNASEAR